MSAFGDLFRGKFFGTAFDVSNLMSIAGQLGSIASAFMGASKGDDTPQTTTDRLKGLKGVLGLGDERFMLVKLTELRKELGVAKYRRLMGYLAWETQNAKALSVKLSEGGAAIVAYLYLSRMRTLLAGMPDSPGQKTGSRRFTMSFGRKGAPGKKKKKGSGTPDTKDDGGETTSDSSTGPHFSYTHNADEMSAGGKPSITALVGLSQEIDFHWSSLSKEYAGEPKSEERLNRAFAMTKESYRISGMPRIPTPEQVPDLKAFVAWVNHHGGLPFRLSAKLVESLHQYSTTAAKVAADRIGVEAAAIDSTIRSIGRAQLERERQQRLRLEKWKLRFQMLLSIRLDWSHPGTYVFLFTVVSVITLILVLI